MASCSIVYLHCQWITAVTVSGELFARLLRAINMPLLWTLKTDFRVRTDRLRYHSPPRALRSSGMRTLLGLRSCRDPLSLAPSSAVTATARGLVFTLTPEMTSVTYTAKLPICFYAGIPHCNSSARVRNSRLAR